jgi:tRNA1(Val) A37 N6-methylase TrmN6
MPGPAGAASEAVMASDVTVDAFLGGRVDAVQPAAGRHRAGLEAVLLAASLEAGTRGAVFDLGAGVGVAGFCIAARCAGAEVTLVERDPVAVACARAALARPGNAAFARRVTILEADIEARDGLGQARADAVVFNPPFRERSSGSMSPRPARAGAHVLGEGGLDPWFRAAAGLLKSGGTATVIFRADGLDLVLAAAEGRFGGLDILPIHPRAGDPALRVLVRGVKGSRAALRLLPPIVLHRDAGNGFQPEVEAILRDGADLVTAVPAWHLVPRFRSS